MERESTLKAAVLAVVRGEQTLAGLKRAGLTMASRPEFTVVPTVQDVAAGVLHYSTRPRGAKRWAELLIRSEFVALEPAFGTEEWADLMSAIWDFASGNQPPENIVTTARRAMVQQ